MKKENMPSTGGKNICLLIISLLMIGLGLYVLFNPVTALVALALYLGIVFIFMGIGYLLVYKDTQSTMMMVVAILDILVGVIFLTNLGVTAASMPIIFALWCLFIGITQLVEGFELKNVDSSWGWLITSGIIGIVFGFLIFIYPMLGVVTLTVLMGGYLIIYGAMELVRYMRLK